jgi:hypothetical protein
MATDGFEQSELEVPLQRLEDAGAEVEIASIDDDDITGWDEDDWGDEVEVDLKIADVDTDRYDALVLPGGQINPDLLRVEDDELQVDPHRCCQCRRAGGRRERRGRRQYHHQSLSRRPARLLRCDRRSGGRPQGAGVAVPSSIRDC